VQQAQRSSLNPLQQQVWAIVQQNQSKAQSVEDQQLQAQALSLMPLQQWRQAAAEQVELNRLLEPGQSTAAVEDLVMKSMLQWFKQDFFSWVSC
jgi:hypothetical protein